MSLSFSRRSSALGRRAIGGALAAVLAVGLINPVTAAATSAAPAASTLLQADETPVTPGHPTEVVRKYGDGSSATGAALGNGNCDVNDDGFADVVVGAWFWDKGPALNVGAAYVLLGGTDVKPGSLNNPSAAGAVRIDGPVAGAFVGFSVGCLGDVNGDGFDDIGIGYYDNQQIYVVLGAEDFSSVSLEALGTRGYVVKGALAVSGNFGYAISGVGDVNNDGYDDFGVGEVVADNNGRTNSGRVWIIAGQDDVADVDILNPSAGQVILTVDGAAAQERLGTSASVGDVNGDGIDDILLGSYVATPWGTTIAATGAAYLIWGGATGSIDAANLGNKGFTINGPTRQRDRLGISVAAAGDVNGDGLADLLVGADGVSQTGAPRNGGAAIVFGAASNTTVFTDPTSEVSVYTCAAASALGVCAAAADVQPRGYWINGAAASDSTGYSVAGIGDVNNDGTPDFAVGASGFDPVNPANPAATLSGAGAVWVIFGHTGTANVSLAGLPASDGYKIEGLAAGDRLGRQVAGVGDVDGNGYDDFVGSGDFAPRPVAPGTPLAQAGEVAIALVGPQKVTVSAAIEPAAPAVNKGFTVKAEIAPVSAVRGVIEAGTVSVSVDGAELCDDLALTSAAAECVVSDGAVGPGAHQVVVSYAGTTRWAGSEADPIVFSTEKYSTTTTASVGKPSFIAGRDAVPVTVAVSAADGPATGTVRLSYKSATVGLGSLVDGSVVITGAATKLPVGTITLGVKYSGDADHAASAGTVAVKVIKAIPTVTLKLNKTKVRTGAQPLTATVTIKATGLVPNGTVMIRDGGKPLKRVLLRNTTGGTVTITMPKLSVRKHELTAHFTGNSKIEAKVSATATVTVVP